MRNTNPDVFFIIGNQVFLEVILRNQQFFSGIVGQVFQGVDFIQLFLNERQILLVHKLIIEESCKNDLYQ